VNQPDQGMERRVFRLSIWPAVFCAFCVCFLTLVSVSANYAWLTGFCALLTLVVPAICMVGLRNRRVEIVGTTLEDYNWRGRKHLTMDIEDIANIIWDRGSDGGGLYIHSSKGSISVGALAGYQDLVKFIAKRRPDLKIPDGLLG
jgi:hypothetical protein